MEIPVLDHGFVRLVEAMGNDDAIVQAARVSYGQGSKGNEADQKLIKYLLAHDHGTCFEMVQFKFHVKCPIFVARQWFRHRVGCLGGNVELNFDLPRPGRWNYRKYNLSVADVWRKFQPTKGKRKDKQGNPYFKKERVQAMRLRSYNEELNLIEYTHIKDIWESGEQQVWRVTIANGNSIELTDTHLCLTDQGWFQFKDIRDTDKRMAVLVNTAPKKEMEVLIYNDTEIWKKINGFQGKYEISNHGRCRSLLNTQNNPRKIPKIKKATLANNGRLVYNMSENGKTKSFDAARLVLFAFGEKKENNNFACHKNDNQLDNHISNLYWGDATSNHSDKLINNRTCRLNCRFFEIVKIEDCGIQKTYDLEVVGPWHNFSANNFIVHNSFNEISGRYTELTEEFYQPEKFRVPHQKNKQSSVEGDLPHQELAAELKNAYTSIFNTYQSLLNAGVAKEMARIILPVATYTQFYWSVNARSLMNFLRLRMAPDAQWEIQAFANHCFEIMKSVIPHTSRFFQDSLPFLNKTSQ